MRVAVAAKKIQGLALTAAAGCAVEVSPRAPAVAEGADSTATTRSKASRELPREEADAGKEIPGQLALWPRHRSTSASTSQRLT
jgi:hypothetical protein